MNISYYTIRAGLNPASGFGYAGQNVVKSLQSLGHTVTWADPKAEIQINFAQPDHFKLHRGQYQIGYTPWESTEISKSWRYRFNLCDEVWATSDWVAEVYKDNGVTKPIYVYSHGIEDIWSPRRRVLKEGRPLRFLHIGEPAPRKEGQLVVETFIKLFGGNPEYHLTIKAHNNNTIRIYKDGKYYPDPSAAYSNITLITEEYSIEQLVFLYHQHHVLVYPTWGEGFGFIPLQGLATGMPVISTYGWAHYKDYLGPLKLKSILTDETLPKSVGDIELGKMYKPDKLHLEDQMVEAVINYKAYSGYYFSQAAKIHEDYNWLQLTEKAFEHLVKKFE